MLDRILFYHGITADFPERRFTVAAQFTGDDFNAAVSICSPYDQFIKKTGRKKAEGRLISFQSRGRLMTSLYSDRFFKPNKSGTFKENYFEGKEIKIFLKLCKKFEKMTFSELKSTFNLRQH